MLVWVLRNAEFGDTTLDGISSLHTRLTVIGSVVYRPGEMRTEVRPLPAEAQVFRPSKEAPAVALEVRKSDFGAIPTLVPTSYDAETERWLIKPGSTIAGGNYATVSDSRFDRVLRECLGHGFYGALSIHDRRETYEWQP